MHRLMRILHAFFLALFLALVASLLGGSDQVLLEKPEDLARRFTRALEFDYIDWTLDALVVKFEQAAIGSPFYFEERDRQEIVQDYLDLMDKILYGEYELEMIYANPAIPDPQQASDDLRARLEGYYEQQRLLAPLAEAVLEQQIAAILVDLEMTFIGQPVPPVSFHISPLPYHLVISPRDRIQSDASISLLPDLTVDKQVILEDQVIAGMDVSALVVPVGGIGSYPTMVMRTTAFDWLVDTIAHEWIHNWLNLRPLGINYMTTPELRTMNETTASIAGGEIARLVLDRFYPEASARYPMTNIGLGEAPIPPGGFPRPVFDFRAEMHTTRLRVDELLAEDKIEEAEAYMEQRRLVFWENGYQIRRLNQAYFAFYGAYADVPGGAAGEDPVGPAVRALRASSANLTEFLRSIARMNSFDDLQKVTSP